MQYIKPTQSDFIFCLPHKTNPFLMLKIKIPPYFLPEKKYILHILFTEFLNIPINIEIKDGVDWKIILPNNKLIIFSDSFFSKLGSRNYIKKENIPNAVKSFESQFTNHTATPILWGHINTEISENKITCQADIFASAFFMLTRWEEALEGNKDQLGRLPDENHLAVKFNFSHRPIVNEYTEMLKKMLLHFGYKVEDKHKYSVKITHDIDFFKKYSGLKSSAKSVGGDLLKRKSTRLAASSLKKIWHIKTGNKKDPFDTFDSLMKISEKYGTTSHFYFIPGKIGEDDAQYNIDNKKVVATIKKIIEKGHKVGLHASLNSYNQKDKFNTEVARIRAIHAEITEGRQHYLCFKNPKTWQLWEDAKLTGDSSMSYTHQGGFRCGTCYEYSTFNILTRKMLKLKQQPLIAMETALARTEPSPEELYLAFKKLIKTVKKYNGQFVLLWHNNNFNLPEWKKYNPVYEKIVAFAKP